MTRIVAGAAGGRTLQVPRSGTRPTSERVREALFSRLEHLGVVRDAEVLDLYAGSGALGLEAASRGAARVILVESARPAAGLIRRNAASLELDVEVVPARVETYLAGPPRPSHLALLDPPYDLDDAALARVLERLAAGWLHPDAVVVVERSRRSPEPAWPAGLSLLDERTYGDTRAWFAEPDAPA
ncbi:16S rRNA (guanine(966)-N(2))-methyltransferase RsmD [Georgenia alba]|uniref:16S rRNA (Guanine(966)-N(2))-methyltransferase RsmD n=1 Tax=Georgenia alba TaxID=2233858 RepID=A0ABW2Q7K0_9MICO